MATSSSAQLIGAGIFESILKSLSVTRILSLIFHRLKEDELMVQGRRLRLGAYRVVLRPLM
jgi:hypothetical protein